MLIIAKKINELNFSQLMTVYYEGNRENGSVNYPDFPVEEQILYAEQDFYSYLSQEFFRTKGSSYAIWAPDGMYVAALRLEPYKDGLLLEALETAPAFRNKGFATALIRAVISYLSDSGFEKIYSHVIKTNLPSLKVHYHCGFQKIMDYAVYIDGSVSQKAYTLCFEL